MKRVPVTIRRNEVNGVFSAIGKVYDVRQVKKSSSYCTYFVVSSFMHVFTRTVIHILGYEL